MLQNIFGIFSTGIRHRMLEHLQSSLHHSQIASTTLQISWPRLTYQSRKFRHRLQFRLIRIAEAATNIPPSEGGNFNSTSNRRRARHIYLFDIEVRRGGVIAGLCGVESFILWSAGSNLDIGVEVRNASNPPLCSIVRRPAVLVRTFTQRSRDSL